MKKYIYIIIWLLSPLLLPAQNNITQAQYWFDGQYSTAVTQNAGPGSDFTLNEMIDVSGLIHGLHTITYRFKDQRGIWGPVITRFFTYYQGSGDAGIREITEMEYWYDDGYGNAVITPIPSGAAIQFSDFLNIETLNYGLHTLNFRFRDDRNIWGPQQSKFFSKNAASGIHEIVRYEYWLNDDYAGKTSKAVTAAINLDVDEVLDVSSLSPGIHTINFRFQDAAGKWSASRASMFHNVPGQNGPELRKVVAMEYWFNGDRTALEKSAVSGNETFQLSTVLDVSKLHHGLHYLSYRFLDEAGNWSSAVSKFFGHYPETKIPEMHEITALEYWFDGDYSTATNQSVSASQLQNIHEMLDVSSLVHGLHYLSYRFKDETGEWSSAVSKFFAHFPATESAEMGEIVEYEYWFNGDKTNSVNIPVANSQVFTIDETIDVQTLGKGLHIISHRFKDKSGKWSPVESRFFNNFEDETLPVDNKIVAYRYWEDGKISDAVEVTLTTPVKSLVLDELVDVSEFLSGNRFFNIQFKDEQNQWSPAAGDTALFEPNPWTELSVSEDSVCKNNAVLFFADTTDVTNILWDFGDGQNSAEFNPVHHYDTVGVFEVSALVSYLPTGKSKTVYLDDSIVVFPVYNETQDTVICSDQTPYVLGSQQLYQSGSYTETFQTIHGCDSVVSLNLTVNQSYEIVLGGMNYLVDDSFEEDEPGTLPNGWTIRYNGTGNANQKVVSNPVKNGQHSFQVSGSGWAANLSKPVDTFPEKVTLEGWMRAENVISGGRCGLGIGNPSVGSWGAFLARVEFCNGNLIAYNYSGYSGGYGTQFVLQTATANTWYHIKIECDRAAGTYQVFINNQPTSGTAGGQTYSEFPLLTTVAPASVELYGNSMIYFDDVKLYETGSAVVELCSDELPYELGFRQIWDSGTYSETFQTIHGCDSIVTLHLVVKDCAYACFDTDLETGWNIMSLPVLPDNSDVQNIFQPLIDNGSLVKIQDEGGKSLEDWGDALGGWKNSVGNLYLSEGYKAKVNADAGWEVCGRLPEYPFSIALKPGWNIAGFPHLSATNAAEVVQQLRNSGTLLKVQDESGKSLEDWGEALGGWQNNIGNFYPGKGYKIKVNAADTLRIQQYYPKSTVLKPEVPRGIHFRKAFRGKGFDHMNINLMDLPAEVLQAGDELAVFDGTVCVGAAVVQARHLVVRSISIPASAADGLGMPGFTEGSPVMLKLWKSDENKVYDLNFEVVKGTPYFVRHESVFGSLGNYASMGLTPDVENLVHKMSCYPNPFSRELSIELHLACNADVELEVFSQTGQKVKTIMPGTLLNSGQHRLVWNGKNSGDSSVSPGVYFIRIKINEENYFEKVILHQKE